MRNRKRCFVAVLAITILSIAGCGGGGAPKDRAPSPAQPSVEISASRLFVAPGDMPPNVFAAYGVVAFGAAATDETRARYTAVCAGYIAGLPMAQLLARRGVSLAQQMATVWPLGTPDLANDLNEANRHDTDVCPDVVADTDLVASRDAIAKARRATGQALAGQGPFLLAWSPSTTFGQAEVPVLVWDMTNVTNATQATDMFSDWAIEIERSPELWADGWNLEKLRSTLRLLADKYGAGVIALIGGG